MTWLSSDILNSEHAIENFQFFRLDRPHGGSVAIYEHFSLYVIPLHLNNSHELLLLSVKLHECTFTYGVFCRPPPSIKDVLFITDSLSSLSPKVFSGLVLAGDFNVNVDISSSSLPLSRQLTVLSDILSLKQLVPSPIYTSHTGLTSIIDLVFVPSDVHAFLWSYHLNPPLITTVSRWKYSFLFLSFQESVQA